MIWKSMTGCKKFIGFFSKSIIILIEIAYLFIDMEVTLIPYEIVFGLFFICWTAAEDYSQNITKWIL